MPAEFKFTRRVAFAETDLAGVMHFSNYYRWMEEVEHAFLRSLDLSVITERSEGTVSWPRATASCEYFGPLHYDDIVELRLTVVGLSEKSLTHEVEFYLGAKRMARGRIKMVCCKTGNGQFASIPIPADIRAKLSPYLLASAQ